MGEKERLLRNVRKETLLQLARPACPALFNGKTSRHNLIRLVKGSLSVAEIKRELGICSALKRRGTITAIMMLIIVYGTFVLCSTLAVGNYVTEKSMTASPELQGSTTSEETSLSDIAFVQGTSDGGYMMAGYLTYYFMIGLVKLDSAGVEQWRVTVNGTVGTSLWYAHETPDRGFIMAGSAIAPGDQNPQYPWLAKVDASGRMLWFKEFWKKNASFGPEDHVTTYGLETSDGGYVLAGYGSTSALGRYAWLLKTNSSGDAQWNRTYLEPSLRMTRTAMQTSDEGFLIVGEWESPACETFMWLLKTSQDGEKQWLSTRYIGDRAAHLFSVSEIREGGYIIIARSGTPFDLIFIKTGSDGRMEWATTHTGDVVYDANLVQQARDGGFLIAGCALPSGAYEFDAWLAKMDPSGNIEWEKLLRREGEERAYSLMQAPDGAYTVTGTIKLSSGYALWLVRLAVPMPLILVAQFIILQTVLGSVFVIFIARISRRKPRMR